MPSSSASGARRIGRGGIAAMLCVMGLAVTAGGQERHEYRQVVMGVEARLVLHAADEPRARDAAAAAIARLNAIDAALSDWRDDSDLSRFEQQAGSGWVPVTGDLLVVLARASELAAATDGAFDPTVGPLVELWREARRTGVQPPEEDRLAAHRLVGWEGLVVQPDHGRAKLTMAGMQLDLGACAKGWAAEQALEVLADQGCPASLVDLGGDLALGDPPPGEPGWRVAVGCPLPGADPRVLTLASTTVATSGSTEQFLEVDGHRLSHVLDPHSGVPLEDAPCVTVIASEGLVADALASALMVLGEDAGRAVLFEHFPEARVLVDDPRRSTLFDGRTLAGWTTTGGRYDGAARWSVEQGAIVGRTSEDGEGGLLYTTETYTSFDFRCEVWLEHPFDSGVFVRMVPPGGGRGAQITLDDRPGGELGAVYADGFLAHQPLGERVWRRDDWNHVRVRCTGADMHLQTWFNGVLVMDHQLPPGSEGFAPGGLIGIQVHGGGRELGHGGSARFRDLTIEVLPDD